MWVGDRARPEWMSRRFEVEPGMTRFKVGLDASFMMEYDSDYSLVYPIKAERAGFDHLWLGDHFLPWHDSFEHNFFVWEVLAAIAARTKSIKVGPDVTVPIGGRYHPAIIAQAGATMDRLFPGRFVLGLGSGEAMNEKWFLGSWPRWPERMERLLEATELIRRLWAEKDYFGFDGKYFKMGMTKLYLRPRTRNLPIYISAVGEKAAYQAGRHADCLISSGNVERMRDVVFPRFDEGARSVGRDTSRMEKAVLMDMATGPEEKILKRVRRLSAGSTIRTMVDEGDPREIEKAGAKLPKEEIMKNICIFAGPDEVIEAVSRFRKIGATQVIIGDMSVEPAAAMATYSKAIRHFREER